MERLSADGSLSHDSAIGTPQKMDSSRVSDTVPSAFSPLAAPSTPTNSSVPSVPSNGSYTTAPESPTSRSRQTVEENNVVHRVLSLPRGRRTPSLRNAPDLRWNLSQPPRLSLDEPGSVVSEDDVPVDRRENQRARLSPLVEGPSPAGERPSSDEERPITPLLPPTPTRQDAAHVNFSRPNPVRIRDALAEYQPHRLSPLDESTDLRPRRYPGEGEGHPAYSPQPSYGSISSRVTYSGEDEDPSLSTAQLISVRRVTPEDTGRDEEAIANRQLEPLFARTPPFETPEEEMMHFYRQLRQRANKQTAWERRHPYRHGMRKAWRKVKDFFNF